jgi:radical SAM protein with 4Fe4S-binding SPASM domain
MNLLVTDYCNRACPYCFARNKVRVNEEISSFSGKSISLENVDVYLDFLVRSQEEVFKILGGEPTLHPQLPEIIERGIAKSLKVEIFTNGLWPKLFRDYWRRKRTVEVEFIINTNEPSLQKSWENDLQYECFEIAGQQACIGFNLYREDFNLLFAGDLIDRFSLKRNIRIGIANPIVGRDIAYIRNSSLRKAAKRLVEQLRQLEKRDILGSFDCGFTLCMFDEKDLGTLALTSTGFSSACGSAIDVDPDLTVWPCFPLSDILNVHLLEFRNRAEITAYYKRKTAPLRSFGSRDDCLSCKYLRRGQCTGGCLGRVINAWKETGDLRLLEKLERTK